MQPASSRVSEVTVSGWDPGEQGISVQRAEAAEARADGWSAPTDNDGLRLLPERRSGVLWRWLELVRPADSERSSRRSV